MNGIFIALIFIAFSMAAFNTLTGDATAMQALSTAMVDAAKSSVDLALGLVGVMALFLGLMKVVEKGGLLTILAKLIRPLMIRLFPEIPPNHPAMGAMILNLAANALGLGNAATPFGIRAMQALDSLNPQKGTATNSMALFLAINTSSVTLLPTGVITLRAAAGSLDPAAILPTTLFATICSTTVAILAARLYQRFSPAPTSQTNNAENITMDDSLSIDQKEMLQNSHTATSTTASYLFLAAILCLVPLTILYGKAISPWVMPGLMVGMLGFGMLRGVKVYEAFIEGAKEGFDVALKIIPYLVAILVAVGMFRASGAMNLLIGLLSPITSWFGLPAEALPMALLRPLSGSGAYGILADTIQNPAIGPDSYVGLLVSTLQGSTETTFYVLAVYFGAVQIKRVRHALATALTADLAGILAAVFICHLLFA
ncbi:nucleoside recognition domain protein [Magnetococcus marinus MC-1]|uniref:Nucleoside recognition domain protein n=1 Tax=Magnetococcus marinus (strain ATCC BAA-1437 / JCM 17883 / MC-1) TaxID=156889 RepID=A0L3Z1_MAGMM|nr:spore maturation protein [Magnetococcus marinus]ABK42684.1 nucleoside recognition domain protein [Magnetococcus marinus MC-1]